MNLGNKMQIIKKLLFVLIICILPCGCLGFDVSKLADYQGVVVKTMVESDTLHKKTSKKTEIRNGEALRKILGDEKVKFKTQYVYIGNKEISHLGATTWYHYTPKSSNKKVYHLYYQKNDVMYEGNIGDTLVVAKKSDDEILLLIVQHNSPAEQELYGVLGMTAPEKQKKSWWKKLWSSSSKEEVAYDIDTTASQMPQISAKSWARVYFTPGPECENNIVSGIDSAIKTIDVAVYSITNDKIVDSLIAAHNRGVKVRVISDRLQSSGRASLIGRIQDAGIPVVLNKKHKIMHNKFAIFDATDIETGSYNWTSSATQSNAENCMFFTQQDKVFSRQFKYLWDLYQK